MVMTVHCGQYVFPKGSLAYDIIHLGLYGVPVFFTLSGYLAMQSIKRGTTLKKYYRNRLIRILPSYYLCLFITSLFITMPADDLGLEWIRYILFLNIFLPSSEPQWININGYWCMPVFMFFYLIVPLLHKHFNSYFRIIVLATITILIALITNHFFIQRGTPQMGLPIFFDSIPSFLMGGAISFVDKNKQMNFTIVGVILFLITIFIFPKSYVVWSIGTAFLILWFNKPINNKLWDIPISFFAKISFDVYLVHMMVLNILCENHVQPKLFVILFFVCSIIFATMLYYLIDRNTIKIKR